MRSPGLRERLGALALLALVQVAGPFILISVGQQEIASSLAGILVASAPIFTALLAVWVDHEERSHGVALAGVLSGMAGVALLLGVDTGGGTAALVGGLHGAGRQPRLRDRGPLAQAPPERAPSRSGS